MMVMLAELITCSGAPLSLSGTPQTFSVLSWLTDAKNLYLFGAKQTLDTFSL